MNGNPWKFGLLFIFLQAWIFGRVCWVGHDMTCKVWIGRKQYRYFWNVYSLYCHEDILTTSPFAFHFFSIFKFFFLKKSKLFLGPKHKYNLYIHKLCIKTLKIGLKCFENLISHNSILNVFFNRNANPREFWMYYLT